MGRMLVALNEGGIMEQFTEGAAPYEEVALLDCQNGEAGDTFTFGEQWRSLVEGYFSGELPSWIQFEPDAESPGAAPAQQGCDGNHGGPRCGDPGCWNVEVAAVEEVSLKEALEKIAQWPDGGNTSGQNNIKAFAQGMLRSHEALYGNPSNPEAMKRRVESGIQYLREQAIEPFVLHLDEGKQFSVELTPSKPEAGCDQRVLVCREGLGYTTVNYTSEGLILDVYSNGYELEPVHTACVYAEDLAGERLQEGAEPNAGRAA